VLVSALETINGRKGLWAKEEAAILQDFEVSWWECLHRAIRYLVLGTSSPLCPYDPMISYVEKAEGASGFTGF
jgi:hypothetical protein